MSKVLDKYFSRFFKKHGKNKALKLLISTNNYYLCEFDRKGQTYPERIIWGGMIVENVLYGNNEMGKYLMIIRDILIS